MKYDTDPGEYESDDESNYDKDSGVGDLDNGDDFRDEEDRWLVSIGDIDQFVSQNEDEFYGNHAGVADEIRRRRGLPTQDNPDAIYEESEENGKDGGNEKDEGNTTRVEIYDTSSESDSDSDSDSGPDIELFQTYVRMFGPRIMEQRLGMPTGTIHPEFDYGVFLASKA